MVEPYCIVPQTQSSTSTATGFPRKSLSPRIPLSSSCRRRAEGRRSKRTWEMSRSTTSVSTLAAVKVRKIHNLAIFCHSIFAVAVIFVPCIILYIFIRCATFQTTTRANLASTVSKLQTRCGVCPGIVCLACHSTRPTGATSSKTRATTRTGGSGRGCRPPPTLALTSWTWARTVRTC